MNSIVDDLIKNRNLYNEIKIKKMIRDRDELYKIMINIANYDVDYQVDHNTLCIEDKEYRGRKEI